MQRTVYFRETCRGRGGQKSYGDFLYCTLASYAISLMAGTFFVHIENWANTSAAAAQPIDQKYAYFALGTAIFGQAINMKSGAPAIPGLTSDHNISI